jgi:hypothetical protein
MAHFARVLNGIVDTVIVAEQEFIDTFVDVNPGNWIQCSYNTREGVHYDPETQEPSADQTKALRGNYPCIGWKYDEDLDAFYEQQPFPSWTLNTTKFKWEPPVALPGKGYHWSEENYQAALSDSSDLSVAWVMG